MLSLAQEWICLPIQVSARGTLKPFRVTLYGAPHPPPVDPQRLTVGHGGVRMRRMACDAKL
jgi:hypothetical protein